MTNSPLRIARPPRFPTSSRTGHRQVLFPSIEGPHVDHHMLMPRSRRGCRNMHTSGHGPRYAPLPRVRVSHNFSRARVSRRVILAGHKHHAGDLHRAEVHRDIGARDGAAACAEQWLPWLYMLGTLTSKSRSSSDLIMSGPSFYQQGHARDMITEGLPVHPHGHTQSTRQHFDCLEEISRH